MKIAQIAPLAESVPPRLYGGTERVVSYLTEELVRQGHDVTLFASGDSRTTAQLVPCTSTALRLTPGVADYMPWHIIMIDQVRQQAEDFDVLHFHIDQLHFPLLRTLGRPAVTTLHGRQDLPDLPAFYCHFADVPLVSISDHQRTPLPAINWVRTIYHGLPRHLYTFRPQPDPEGYLVFLGRISPEKRPDRAIDIATRACMPLKIAAKIDAVDADYWRDVIEPMVRRNPLVEFVGEVGDADKEALLGGATALLFPIDWPEPFGLVMIEAMACGTPVIAFPHGSVIEVIDHGVSGFLAANVADAAAALNRIGDLDRKMVRATFERRFDIARVAHNYLSVYVSLCGESPVRVAGGSALPLRA